MHPWKQAGTPPFLLFSPVAALEWLDVVLDPYFAGILVLTWPRSAQRSWLLQHWTLSPPETWSDWSPNVVIRDQPPGLRRPPGIW